MCFYCRSAWLEGMSLDILFPFGLQGLLFVLLWVPCLLLSTASFCSGGFEFALALFVYVSAFGVSGFV